MKIKIQINKNNIITGLFCLYQENPYKAFGVNFCNNKPYIEAKVNNAVLDTDIPIFEAEENDIRRIVGECKLVNGEVVRMTEQEIADFKAEV